MSSDKYTLLTRSNFDGIICAALLREAGIVDEVQFVHPKDVQDGLIEVTDRNITTSLPYSPDAYLVFDHHSSELYRNPEIKENHIIEATSPSSSRVVFEYLGGQEKFGDKFNELLDAVDQADCSAYTKEDILNPKGWTLINYIMDPRTGLGRYRNFSISNYKFLQDMIDYCRKMTIDEILNLSDVVERLKMYKREEYSFKKQIKRCTKVKSNVAIINLRDEEIIYAGNRFMVYPLFNKCNISIHCMRGHNNDKTIFAVGKSIINRSASLDIGALMYEYGGGGHQNAGTCQIENFRADDVLNELIDRLSI